MKKHLFKGPTTITLCKAMLMNFISNFERGEGGHNLGASTLIDFIAFINDKESTYNRIGNYNGRILWHQRFEAPTHLGM